jgi:hypothetical protein
MSIPLHLAHGPYGLEAIDFRSPLLRADLDNLVLVVRPPQERTVGVYWIAFSSGSGDCIDAYCHATTKAERNEAINWLRNMAAVLKGGET